MALALAGGARQLVHHAPQLVRAEAEDARGLQHLRRRDRRALLVVGEHVGQPHERGLAFDVGVVVALDRGGDEAGQAPAAGQHAADERVVDAQLAALAGGCAPPGSCAPRWTCAGSRDRRAAARACRRRAAGS